MSETTERKADILEEDCEDCNILPGHRKGDESRCHGCDLPMFYDRTVEDYRHVDPTAECFLIAADA